VSVFAPARSSSPTIVGVEACTHGRYAEEKTVEAPAHAIARIAEPRAAATNVSRPMTAARATSATIITLLRSNRSAMTPPSVLRATYGTNRTRLVAATHAPDPERSSTNTISAML
jgi:hypothetical protein